MKRPIIDINPLYAIVIFSPAFLYFLCWLLPTFDDWTYFTTPNYDFGHEFTNRLMPIASYWRPWDALLGYVLSLNHALFPTLNHIVVYLGHLMATITVFLIAGQLHFGRAGRHVATLFFFLSPGMLGTVLGIDSANQTYATAWGLASTCIYLQADRPVNKAAWIACVTMALLSKENGIVYFVIPPFIAWAFDRQPLRTALRDILVSLAFISIYFIVRTALTTEVVEINDEYFDNSLYRKAKNIAVFLGMTWIPLDFVSLVYPPSRSLPIVAVTFLLGMPLLAAIFLTTRKEWLSRPFLCLTACLFIAVSPHLVTLFTSMHPYAGLGFASLMLGYLTGKSHNIRLINRLLLPFILSCLFIDWHHWQKSYESGLTGQKMGKEAVQKTGKRVDRVFIINRETDEDFYSSFCVTPYKAFAWGYAAVAATDYQWPTVLSDTTINVHDQPSFDAQAIADQAIRQGYQKVWLVHGDTIDIIR